MEIRTFNDSNRQEYSAIVDKYNNIPEFNLLTSRQINVEGRTIFLVLDKGILRKYNILAYAIIDTNLSLMCKCHNMSNEYEDKENIIYISDFIVRDAQREKGIGKTLARYILQEKYFNKDIVLQPHDDGYWFWNKFGFKNDNISKHETWILKRGI